MELLFVYIENYKNIIDKGFNFGSEYQFSVKKEHSKLKLSIEKHESSIPKYFFGSSIVNISAIIGKNGAGKSNLIEALRSDSEKTLQIWKTKDGKLYYSIDNERRSEQLTLDIPIGYKSLFANTHEPCVVRSVFYSSIFDMRNYPYETYPKEVDVSSNYLLFKDAKDESSGKVAYDQITFHRFRDIKRQIDLVYSGLMYPDSFSVSIPQKIIFKATDITYVTKTEEEWNLDDNSRLIRKFLLEKLYAIITSLGDDERTATEEQDRKQAKVKKIEYFFQRNLLESFFYNRGKTNSFQQINLGVDFRTIKGLEIDEALQYFAKNQNWISPDILSEFFTSIKTLFESAIKNDYPVDDSYVRTLAVPFPSDEFISIQSYQLNYISEISRVNTRVTVLSPFDYDWRDMSSGEKAMLNLFSRLLYAKQELIYQQKYPANIGENRKEIDHINIHIDEGEVGFHPEWQRKYLNILLKFIPVCFYHKEYMSNTKFQIFLTSHSPFLVSDLPKECITFLEPDKNYNLVISKLEKHRNTFGANIHSLFADSFFMDDGVIGEFAKIKINELIRDINDSTDKNTDLEKAIELIGEPVIKVKLRKMYDERFVLEDEIEKLEIRLKDLRQKKHDSDSKA